MQDPDGRGYHNWANVSAVFAQHWKDIGLPVYEEIWNEPDLVRPPRSLDSLVWPSTSLGGR